ncbi:MAG: patatin-like phospholipase family protein [Elusimicrobia bacterium]|nr:patatin-like phospholipase family protein [Elusimicrobiota bacterium]
MMHRTLIYVLFLISWLSHLPLVHGTESPDTLLRDFLWEELAELPASQRPKVGLVLSGGGARGFAHVGTIEVLERAGFPVDVVAGTSIGAIVGSMYASGAFTAKLKELARAARFDQGTNLNRIGLIRLMVTESLLSTKKMENYIQSVVGNKQFHELKKPFACVAMDLKTGERIIFKEGWVAPAVRASMNLPGLFKPVEYRHRYLVDGGVVDYIPVDAARQLGAQYVLASITEGDFSQTSVTNVLLYLQQVIDIRGALLSKASRESANFIVEHAVGDIHFHEFTRSGEAVERGTIATQERLSKAKEQYILFSMPYLMTSWKKGTQFDYEANIPKKIN